MTTIDAAAAWTTGKSLARPLMLALLAASLAGCESGTSLFGSAAPGTAPLSDAGQTPPAAEPARIAIAPIIGAPDAVSRQMTSQLAAALERQKVAVAKSPNDKAEYTARGYVVSTNDRKGTKISYIWELTDASGTRVNRVTGEEIVPGAKSKDPWSAVSPEVVEKIANKTAASVIAWLPPGKSGMAIAQGGPASAPPSSAGPAASPSPTPGPTPTASAAPLGPTTGSINRKGPFSAQVRDVTGAPGDGSVSLAAALRRELGKAGVKQEGAGSGAFSVKGKVSVGEGANGKQPIEISWSLYETVDGKEHYSGTVTQKNDVPQGSLDGQWGGTADAAAAAAVPSIIKLMEADRRKEAGSGPGASPG